MTAAIQEADIQGVSTRSVDDLVKAMGMTGISKSQVSRLCAEIDERIDAFLNRPLEGEWPYLWLDATYLKVHRNGKLIEAFRPRHTRLAELMERAEHDVLAYKSFLKPHWFQIHSTIPLERLNKEIKRRTNTIGIFPNAAAVTLSPAVQK